MSLSRIRRATSTVSFIQMNKEDHERERTRWLTKLEEIEARLAESETLNSDMQQIRAELVSFYKGKYLATIWISVCKHRVTLFFN